MKRLLIIRHAKTEQINYENDFERTLTERGHKDCKTMSARFMKLGVVPDMVLVSPSKRTRQTADNLAKYLKWDKQSLVTLPNLYNASQKVLFNEIMLTDNSTNTLALVGHNPGITELFSSLSLDSIDNLPTTGMGLFELKISNWQDLKADSGILIWKSWPSKED